MQKDTEKTKVIFRVDERDNQSEVIAVFPALAGTNNPYTCGAYVHMGQHTVVHMDIVQVTRPAKPSEFKALQEELEFLGYNLQIVKRFSRKDLEARKEQCNGK